MWKDLQDRSEPLKADRPVRHLIEYREFQSILRAVTDVAKATASLSGEAHAESRDA